MDMDINFNLNSKNLSLISTDDNEINFIQLNSNTYSLLLNNKSYYISINKQNNQFEVNINHIPYLVDVQDIHDIFLKTIGMDKKNLSKLGEVQALIPGLVSKLFVIEGESVKIGQKLIILEAMKMENEIASPINGTIKKIYIQPGDKIDKGSIIMEITE